VPINGRADAGVRPKSGYDLEHFFVGQNDKQQVTAIAVSRGPIQILASVGKHEQQRVNQFIVVGRPSYAESAVLGISPSPARFASSFF
jgi:hypothetical protein